MISSPLLTRVALSTVILAPMRQVGCASTSRTDTSASDSGFRSRKAPPDAVRMTRSTSARAAPAKHCAMATCSLSIGTSSTPDLRAARSKSSPPATIDSLLAMATGMPASRAASVGARPTKPTSALTTRSASLARTRSRRAASVPPAKRARRAGSLDISAAALASVTTKRASGWSTHCARSRSTLRCAAKPTTRNWSGCCRTTSRTLRPIEPVEPRTKIRFMIAWARFKTPPQ